MSLEFDNKISLGHVLTLGVLIFGGVAGYTNLLSQQAQTTLEVATLTKMSNDRELRIRAVEIAQAGQTSDLRTIQIGILEIKAALEKLGDRP